MTTGSLLMAGGAACAAGAVALALGADRIGGGAGRWRAGWSAMAAVAVVVAAARGDGAVAAGIAVGAGLFVASAQLGAALLASRAPAGAPPAVLVLTPAMPLLAAALAMTGQRIGRLEGLGLLAVFAVYASLAVPELRALPARPLRGGDAPGDRRRGAAVLAAAAVAGVAGATLLALGAGRVAGGVALAPGLVGMLAGVPAGADAIARLPVSVRAPGIGAAATAPAAAAAVPALLGLGALVRPLTAGPVASTGFLALVVAWTVAATVWTARRRAGRATGLLLLALAAAWAWFAVGL